MCIPCMHVGRCSTTCARTTGGNGAQDGSSTQCITGASQTLRARQRCTASSSAPGFCVPQVQRSFVPCNRSGKPLSSCADDSATKRAPSWHEPACICEYAVGNVLDCLQNRHGLLQVWQTTISRQASPTCPDTAGFASCNLMPGWYNVALAHHHVHALICGHKYSLPHTHITAGSLHLPAHPHATVCGRSRQVQVRCRIKAHEPPLGHPGWLK